MHVPSVIKFKDMTYPCWNITAYAFFGKTEDYVAINRNYLIPDVESKIYKLISECADVALELFFEYLDIEIKNTIIDMNDCFIEPYAHTNDVGENGSCTSAIKTRLIGLINEIEVCNALSLSLLFHHATAVYRENVHIYQSLSDKLSNNSDFIIPAIEFINNKIMIKNLRAKDITIKNLFYDYWYINPALLPYTSENSEFIHNERNRVLIVQDIFNDYLYKRDFRPFAVDIAILRIEKSLDLKKELIPIYKRNAKKDSYINELSETCYNLFLHEMLNSCMNEIRKNRLDSNASTTESKKNIYVLPAFHMFADLCVSDIPFDIPMMYRYLGKYFIVPFTTHQIMNIKECDIETITTIAHKVKLTNEDYKKSTVDSINKKITEALLAIDADTGYFPSIFEKVVNFVTSEIGKRKEGITMEKIHDDYIKAAVWLIDMLNGDFFDKTKTMCLEISK